MLETGESLDTPQGSESTYDLVRIENEAASRRFIRLLVGLALVSQDYLSQQLPIWEAEAARLIEESKSRQSTRALQPSLLPKVWEYRLVGMAFESPNYFKAGLAQILKAPQAAWRLTAPLRFPLELLGISNLSGDFADNLIRRIQNDLDRLERVGEAEVQSSRALGTAALDSALESILDLLSSSPELRDLVKCQTAGVTNEVVNEIRERSVSSDTLIDAVVRKLLRRSQSQPEEMVPDKSEITQSSDW
jgi:hypothetical protein